jgi:hypothetical protein
VKVGRGTDRLLRCNAWRVTDGCRAFGLPANPRTVVTPPSSPRALRAPGTRPLAEPVAPFQGASGGATAMKQRVVGGRGACAFRRAPARSPSPRTNPAPRRDLRTAGDLAAVQPRVTWTDANEPIEAVSARFPRLHSHGQASAWPPPVRSDQCGHRIWPPRLGSGSRKLGPLGGSRSGRSAPPGFRRVRLPA